MKEKSLSNILCNILLLNYVFRGVYKYKYSRRRILRRAAIFSVVRRLHSVLQTKTEFQLCSALPSLGPDCHVIYAPITY